MQSLSVHLNPSVWRTPPTFLAPCLRSPFSSNSSWSSNNRKIKRKPRRDAYATRLLLSRKDAHVARRAVLGEQRAKDMGDPIRGVDTPFVTSFDNVSAMDPADDKVLSSIVAEAATLNSSSSSTTPPRDKLDHGISESELKAALQHSRTISMPLGPMGSSPDPETIENEHKKFEDRDQTAAEAVQRIVSLANASSKHRTKSNYQRIIETFGRHRTDGVLKPRNTAHGVETANVQEPRVGPDTGSSEVQIGILTAKIRVLADRYAGESRKDKINKRNLRVLVHRRQKLLKYMEAKERGSGRWTHLINTLGLTPATWKGEINVQ